MFCGWEGKTTGLAESNGSLLSSRWLIITCRLTACIPGSDPGPTLGNEYGKPLLSRLRSSWHDFNRHSALHGPSAIAELLVIFYTVHNQFRDNRRAEPSEWSIKIRVRSCAAKLHFVSWSNFRMRASTGRSVHGRAIERKRLDRSYVDLCLTNECVRQID